MIEKGGRASVFQRIFEENRWGNNESVSGEGSNLERTAVIRSQLPALLKRHGVKSMLDAPCGDFFWMQAVPLADIKYIGIDIVQAIVDRNVDLYARPHREFLVGDLVQDVLPAADLILCRDCLVHLTYEE